jgi:hypothetical protein
MADVINPVDVEKAIEECKDRIHNGVSIVITRFRAYKAALRAKDRAYAEAYLRAQGPAHEKRYRAELDEAHVAARDAVDDAEAVYQHADKTAWALINELKAWQSIGASVRSMYGAENGFGR